jgi:hypothetical protein
MSMRSLINILKEEVSVSQAYDFLRSKGVNTVKLDAEALKAAARGKSAEDRQKMKAAFDFIKKNEPENARAPEEKMKWRNIEKPGSTEAPPWAQGLNDWTINKDDFTDANYLRKTIWEISGKPNTALSLWVWNGERFGQHIVVLSKAKYFKEMAKAMVKYARGEAKAVFFKGQGPEFVLIYNEGRFLDKPIAFQTKVGGRNPNNDWDLVATLPRRLAQINRKAENEEDDTAGDFKAWVNTEDKKVHAFDPEWTYYDAIRRAPNIFGPMGSSPLKMRIQMERKGWCAVGVNTNDGVTGAVVTALNDKFALQAARMLFRKRYNKGDWNTLKIKTNDKQFVLKNRHEIRDYLLKGVVPDTKDREVHL